MGIWITVGLALAAFAAVGFVVTARRKARHAALMQAPFPESWAVILQKNLPPYPLLPEPLREQLHGYINVFLEDKTFEGCGGQAITDDVRVTIAAQACLLLIGRSVRCYPLLGSLEPGDYSGWDPGGEDLGVRKMKFQSDCKTRPFC